MDQTNKKIITASFLFAGGITAYVVGAIIQILQASVNVFAKFSGNDLVTHGVPLLIGIALFFYLQFNSKINRWADEVVSEIRKMVWIPTKDVVAVTIAVCIMVIISGVLLGVLDLVSSKVMNYLISL